MLPINELDQKIDRDAAALTSCPIRPHPPLPSTIQRVKLQLFRQVPTLGKMRNVAPAFKAIAGHCVRHAEHDLLVQMQPNYLV